MAGMGLGQAQRWRPDLILLDLMLPGHDRIRGARRDPLRRRPRARHHRERARRGSRQGAGLPPRCRPVRHQAGRAARVAGAGACRAATAARAAPARAESRLSFGRVSVETAARIVSVEERPVALTPKAYDLMLALVRRQGAVASRVELLREVWGTAGDVQTRTVDSHMAELRRKLEVNPADPRAFPHRLEGRLSLRALTLACPILRTTFAQLHHQLPSPGLVLCRVLNDPEARPCCPITPRCSSPRPCSFPARRTRRRATACSSRPSWLQAHLSDPDLVLLQVGERAEYDREHIPGAVPASCAASPIARRAGSPRNAADHRARLGPRRARRHRGVEGRALLRFRLGQPDHPCVAHSGVRRPGRPVRSSSTAGLPAWKAAGYAVTSEVPAAPKVTRLVDDA